MADTPKENETKFTRFLNALKTLAPDKTFGGITPAVFTAQVADSNAPRQKIIELKAEITEQDAKRETADASTMKMCERIKNGVIADPDFGDDSALYEALGYVRKSERKTGLTRKKTEAKPVKT